MFVFPFHLTPPNSFAGAAFHRTSAYRSRRAFSLMGNPYTLVLSRNKVFPMSQKKAASISGYSLTFALKRESVNGYGNPYSTLPKSYVSAVSFTSTPFRCQKSYFYTSIFFSLKQFGLCFFRRTLYPILPHSAIYFLFRLMLR